MKSIDIVTTPGYRRSVRLIMAETTQAIMIKAIGEVWAKETKILLAKGQEPVLKRSRWMLLKRPVNPAGRGATSRRG